MPDKTSAQYLAEAMHSAEIAAELRDKGGEEGSYNLVESEWRQRQAIADGLISLNLRLAKLTSIVERHFLGVL